MIISGYILLSVKAFTHWELLSEWKTFYTLLYITILFIFIVSKFTLFFYDVKVIEGQRHLFQKGTRKQLICIYLHEV